MNVIENQNLKKYLLRPPQISVKHTDGSDENIQNDIVFNFINLVSTHPSSESKTVICLK